MLILTIHSDKPEAEVGLYEVTDQGHAPTQVTHHTWTAHRELGRTIHTQINELLKGQGKGWSDVQAVVCYKGPGSFTGLRIGLSVGNALAYANHISIVSANGDNWIAQGLTKLADGQNEVTALPDYGSEPFTTQPRK